MIVCNVANRSVTEVTKNKSASISGTQRSDMEGKLLRSYKEIPAENMEYKSFNLKIYF